MAWTTSHPCADGVARRTSPGGRRDSAVESVINRVYSTLRDYDGDCGADDLEDLNDLEVRPHLFRNNLGRFTFLSIPGTEITRANQNEWNNQHKNRYSPISRPFQNEIAILPSRGNDQNSKV